VAGQGAFDNLHLAPRMLAPQAVRDASPGDQRLKEVAMAPFCVHDCLHLHWRWAQWYVNEHTYGWDGDTPYRKAGAPMVPPNQRVSIRVCDPHTAEYHVRMRSPKAGAWQVIMHHGFAYALSVRFAGKAGKAVFPAFLEPSRPTEWGLHAVRNGRIWNWLTRQGLKIVVARVFDEDAWPGESELADSWAMFYLHMRYARKGGVCEERLRFDRERLSAF
jgi:hypothetical protein